MMKSVSFFNLRGLLTSLLFTVILQTVTQGDENQIRPAAEPGVDASQLKFFEERIRPVLVEHCYSCHSADAKSVKGGLLLDSREGVLTGGDSGPSLVVEKPEESLLLQAMRHESLEMPPDRKLPENVLQDFETWIRAGAADPRVGGVVHKKQAINIEKGREFWSFRPIAKPSVPNAGSEWARSDIDRFVADARARHFEQQRKAAEYNAEDPTDVSIAADATPDVIVRRLYFVLTGLPPGLAEQQQFEEQWAGDPDAAVEATIDRLLASPRYGERWGRHWLDVARYAESTGGGRSLMLPDAWRFRDYVIRSFNADKPFDQIVREHLAGDLLPAASDEQRDDQITGVGYLMLGAINYEEQDKEQLRMDVVDEQIDSMGRSFLGMTLGCCRCHDHKFDPIPTADYYALAGIFRSTKSLTPGNVCGFVTSPLRVGYDKQAAEQWASKDAELEKQIASLKKSIGVSVSDRPGAPALSQLEGMVVDDVDAQFEGEWVSSRSQQPFVGVGYRHCAQPRTGLSARYETTLPADGEYVIRMVINHAPSRSDNVPIVIVHADGESVVTANQKVKPDGDGVFADLGRFRFEAATPAVVVVKAAEASPGFVIADAIQFVPVEKMPLQIAEVSEVSPRDLSEIKKQLKTLEAEHKAHGKTKPEVPIVMCVEDEAQPADWHIHVRGEIRNLGPVVPRGFITAATPSSETTTLAPLTSAPTSGRRELAEWVASPRNPLTARVYVNRVWQHVMGEGLVRTPDNFGETGERPSHPELLDYLAATFVEEGWSTKKLIRQLCLTRTFRMASTATNEQQNADPDNRFLTHAFRRRLDAEAFRDSLLQISGALDLSVLSGRTIAKLGTYDNEYRHDAHPLNARSVFVPAFRNTLLDLFEIFDGANPNLVSGKRTRSTRPAQALYMLNSPFVMEQARLAAATFVTTDAFDADRPDFSVRNAWRICTGRLPTDKESATVLTVVNARPGSVEVWSEVFHALFASVDFRYLE